ncbi:MAG: hypothetical protein AAGJ31_09185 [Verrucomicrobiota bacterium]
MINRGSWGLFLIFLLASVPVYGQEDLDAQVHTAAEAVERGPYEVATLGFRNFFSPSRPKREIPVHIYYPSAEGAWPVILISHREGGTIRTHSDLAIHLASHGFMVCCVEHEGSREQDRIKLKVWETLRTMTRDSREVLGRPVDLREVLDQIELWNGGHDALWGKFNLEHVGVFGDSMGAYTAMVACGVRPAVDWIREPVAAADLIKPPKNLLKGNSERKEGLSEETLQDDRIDAAVMLTPPGPREPYFREDSFAELNRPLLGIAAQGDESDRLSPGTRRRWFDASPDTRSMLLWLTDRESSQADSVTPLVKAATVLFFEAYLKGKADSLEELNREALASLIGDPGMEILTKEAPTLEISEATE